MELYGAIGYRCLKKHAVHLERAISRLDFGGVLACLSCKSTLNRHPGHRESPVDLPGGDGSLPAAPQGLPGKGAGEEIGGHRQTAILRLWLAP